MPSYLIIWVCDYLRIWLPKYVTGWVSVYTPAWGYVYSYRTASELASWVFSYVGATSARGKQSNWVGSYRIL